jgi:hypothetical protein
LELPGIEEVYASSGFQILEVCYDPHKLSQEDILAKLGEAGYLGEFPIPAEAGIAAYQSQHGNSFFRHTAVYDSTRQGVSFAQDVHYSGRPVWPCPGFGVIRKVEE